MSEYRNPTPVVDIIITEMNPVCEGGPLIMMISRENAPFGWALPGGFVDEGESFENASVREAKEEVSLDIWLDEMFYTYSDPNRDPRQHNTTTVFIGHRVYQKQEPLAASDAREAKFLSRKQIERLISLNHVPFDHARILIDYFQYFDGVDKKVIFNPMKDVKSTS